MTGGRISGAGREYDDDGALELLRDRDNTPHDRGLGLRGGEGETKLCLSCRVEAEKAGTVTTCRMTVREQENFSRHQRQWHRGTVHLGPACELVPLYSCVVCWTVWYCST